MVIKCCVCGLALWVAFSIDRAVSAFTESVRCRHPATEGSYSPLSGPFQSLGYIPFDTLTVSFRDYGGGRYRCYTFPDGAGFMEPSHPLTRSRCLPRDLEPIPYPELIEIEIRVYCLKSSIRPPTTKALPDPSYGFRPETAQDYLETLDSRFPLQF